MEVKDIRCVRCGRLLLSILSEDFVVRAPCGRCKETYTIQSTGGTITFSIDSFVDVCNKARLEFKRLKTEEHIKNVPRCIILDGD